MFKDRDAAKILVDEMLKTTEIINGSLIDLIGKVSDEELTKAKQAIGRVMTSIYDNILEPVFKDHKDLEPDEMK
jgi:hypothetical protein